MQKLKNLSLNILRICIFYCLKQYFVMITYGVFALTIAALFDIFLKSIDNIFYIIIFFFFNILYFFLTYFVAKKLGLIKIIDNLSFFKALTFILFIEIILVFEFSLPLNYENLPFFEFAISEYRKILSNMPGNSLLGFGWIYPIIAYKTIKLLTTKYPNKFNWILKLYPKKLDEIITFNNFKKIIYKLIINPTKKAIKWLKDNYRPY